MNENENENEKEESSHRPCFDREGFIKFWNENFSGKYGDADHAEEPYFSIAREAYDEGYNSCFEYYV